VLEFSLQNLVSQCYIELTNGVYTAWIEKLCRINLHNVSIEGVYLFKASVYSRHLSTTKPRYIVILIDMKFNHD